MTELNKELWVVEEIKVHYHFINGEISPDHRCGNRLRLVCYNRNTKELLHTYGPFTDAEELFQWAKEHTIQLGEDLPECDHSMWASPVTNSDSKDKKTFWGILRDYITTR